MSEYLVEDTVKCDECGSRKSETATELVVKLLCQDCGLVLEDKVIDQRLSGVCLAPSKVTSVHVLVLQ